MARPNAWRRGFGCAGDEPPCLPASTVEVVPVEHSLDGERHLITNCEHMAARGLLTDFELMILLAAMHGGDDAYAIQIAGEIESTAGRQVQLGAVYAALNRLEARLLVESWTGEPTAERGGRAKRHFRVTPRGVQAVRSTQQALVSLWSGLSQLKERRS